MSSSVIPSTLYVTRATVISQFLVPLNTLSSVRSLNTDLVASPRVGRYIYEDTLILFRGGAVGCSTASQVGMSRVRFPMVSSFRPHYGPGVDSASKRNVYKVYYLFLGVKVAGILTVKVAGA